jgi:hypothetical protein
LIEKFSTNSKDTDYQQLAKRIFDGSTLMKYSEIVKTLMFNENLKEPTAKSRITTMVNMSIIKKSGDKYILSNRDADEDVF